jgi:hypothetical protein
MNLEDDTNADVGLVWLFIGLSFMITKEQQLYHVLHCLRLGTEQLSQSPHAGLAGLT